MIMKAISFGLCLTGMNDFSYNVHYNTYPHLYQALIVCDANILTHRGKEFCFGYMKTAIGSIDFIAIIETDSLSQVSFNIEYPLGNISHNTTKHNQYRLAFTYDISFVETKTSLYADRQKGICITTNSNETLFVAVYLDLDGATSSYLALPYQEILTNEYEYYALSTSSSNDKYYSGLLLVGFRDNTTVVIYPSTNVTIPQDTQNQTSINQLIQPGENHTITLHRRQTLFIGKDQGDDITGTRIVSDKPLTVISGHEAGSVPSDGTLEPIAQQIPPTQLWGDTFLIVPFAGHDEGQYIKVLTSKDNTQVTYNCMDYNSVHIQNAGKVHQFFVSSDTYCYLEANNSVLVGQFAASPSDNTDGDTTMVLVASLDQYSNSFLFLTLNGTNLNHYISISVPIEYFNPDDILYDGELIDVEWTAIYDGENNTIGYGCSFEVSQAIHTVDSKGRLFVMVYGFHALRAYAYAAGYMFSPEGG